MTTFTEALCALIQTEGLGVTGDTLFINSMPATKPNAILLRPPLKGVNIDVSLPGYRRGDFQVIVRAQLMQTGTLLADNLVDALTLYQTNLDRFYVRFFIPLTEPIVYPRGDSGYLEFSTTYAACYSDPTANV